MRADNLGLGGSRVWQDIIIKDTLVHGFEPTTLQLRTSVLIPALPGLQKNAFGMLNIRHISKLKCIMKVIFLEVDGWYGWDTYAG